VSWEHKDLRHGVFFHYVLEGLRGKAKDEDGEVTWNRLSEYVSKQVSRRVPRLVGDGTQQHPNEVKDTEGPPPVLLAVRAAPAPSIKAPAERPRPPKAPMPSFAQEREPREVTNSVGMKQVRVWPGKFRMGSPRSETGRKSDEDQRAVEITRIVRGGAWNSSGSSCRTANRVGLPPNTQRHSVGFRVALVLSSDDLQ
jgi:formylglycine-generating enzyme required for sulfatase activity